MSCELIKYDLLNILNEKTNPVISERTLGVWSMEVSL